MKKPHPNGSRSASPPQDNALTPAVATNMAPEDRHFRAVADFTYDWESWHRPDGQLVWVNPAVTRMTGYTIDTCLAMKDYPLPMIVSEDRERMANVLDLARQRSSGENVEFACLHRNGERRWMSLSWQPMYDPQGEHLGFRTSVRDVTERRNLRDQLRLHTEHLEQLVQERTEKLRQLENRQRQMEKLAALGQLAAGVAHEINNPLAGMRNAFELIRSSLTPDHEHFDLLALIDREIERISGIVHQMYQLYRRVPQQSARFDLVQIVEEVIVMLAPAATKRNVTIHLTPPTDPVEAWWAEGEVKQILYNVIRNALQASAPGQAVEVTIQYRQHEAAVHVRDFGIGIPEHVLPQIFDPFFSTKQGEAQAGMGLGLSVSRSLVEAMGGRLEVETQSQQGSRFSVILPLHLERMQELSNA